MNNNINKPITLIIEDFKKDLVDQINNSNLPIFIIESIVKDVYFEIKEVSKNKTEQDRVAYESSLGNNKMDEKILTPNN